MSEHRIQMLLAELLDVERRYAECKRQMEIDEADSKRVSLMKPPINPAAQNNLAVLHISTATIDQKPTETTIIQPQTPISERINEGDQSETTSQKRDKTNDRWRKTALMIIQKLVDHRAGYAFKRTVETEEYCSMIMHPTSLDLIKSRIRDGLVKTTPELHKELMLMLANAVMYNIDGIVGVKMAQEMVMFVDDCLHQFLINHQQGMSPTRQVL